MVHVIFTVRIVVIIIYSCHSWVCNGMKISCVKQRWFPGMFSIWQLLHNLDQTACRERTGVDWDGSFWINSTLQRFSQEQVQYWFRLFQQHSDSKWTECAVWRHCCVLLCQRATITQTISRPEQKPLSAWTLVTWSHQRRSPQTTNGLNTCSLIKRKTHSAMKKIKGI